MITLNPIAPVGNVGSQLERAICAYVVSCVANLNWDQVHWSMDNRGRAAPLVDVMAHKSTENPTNSRDELFNVLISCEFAAAAQPGAKTQVNWQGVNTLVGTVMAAMSVSDNRGQDFRATAVAITAAGRALAVDDGLNVDPKSADHADMAEFTCAFVQYVGSSRAKQSHDGLFFVEERNFLISACPANVD